MRFVPVSLGTVQAGAPDAVVPLATLHRGFRRAFGPQAPRNGLLALFTAGPPPAGSHQLGLADYLGRWITVRTHAGSTPARTLAHEILHVYGGIHVLPNMASLMNPAGSSLRLDPLNNRIVKAMRNRKFSAAGFERDVVQQVDLQEAIDAYDAALRGNLTLRRQGVELALEKAARSRPLAAREAKESLALDAHLAEVCGGVANFYVAQGRFEEAAGLMEVAADLYGRGSVQARQAMKVSRRLREAARSRGAP